MKSVVTERLVARALRPGEPEVIEVGMEEVAPLGAGEVLVRVEAVGLNHAETLVRSGEYVLRWPFPYAVGLEGAGTVVAAGPEVEMPLGSRVCWTGVRGSCATFVAARAAMLAPIPEGLGFEDGARLAHAGITAGSLARVWPLEGRAAVVWGAAGAVGRLLVAILAERGVEVIGIAGGERVEAVRAAGAAHAVDRTHEDVAEAVHSCTDGRGVAAVFDPVGGATFDTSLRALAPRGCLINYGELSGPVPAIDLYELFAAGSIFVTKFNASAYIDGLDDASGLISDALALAVKRPAVVSDVAGRFPLERVADGFRMLESYPGGKVLVVPDHDGR